MALRINDVQAISIWGQPKLDILGSEKSYRKSIPLHVDWLNFHGALYACQNWHYTGTMPASKTVKIGVWEHGRFIGCVVYSRGATPQIGAPFGLAQTEVCELTRIALRQHKVHVSKLISISLRMLHKLSPGIKMVVSYADLEQGHVGAVYQASNWSYLGEIKSYKYQHGDEVLHGRTMTERHSRANQDINTYARLSGLKLERISGLVRHKYIWPFNDNMKQLAVTLSKPYPRK